MPERALIAKELADILSVIANPCRVRIIEELGQGAKDVNELRKLLGAAQPTISQHLSILRLKRLVSCERKGRHVIYSLTYPFLSAWILEGVRLFEVDKFANKELVKAANKARKLWSLPPA